MFCYFKEFQNISGYYGSLQKYECFVISTKLKFVYMPNLDVPLPPPISLFYFHSPSSSYHINEEGLATFLRTPPDDGHSDGVLGRLVAELPAHLLPLVMLLFQRKT